MTCAKIKIAAIGLGNRTYKYLRFVQEHQDVVELVATVDPDPSKQADFVSFDDLVAAGIGLDACIIGTPDLNHHELAVKAMRQGWHVLLEKPMGQTPEQCLDIAKVSEETGKMATVCYVLRYHPYFIKLKELSQNPALGKILSVKHIERVGHDRTAHTFVRGPWNKQEMNTSVFFTKCCHDVDFVLWLIGNDIKSVSSAKGARIFTSANAPKGAAERCRECQIEQSCKYSAIDLYLRRRDWIKGFVSLPGESQEETIIRMLDESRYGRCIYHCHENDVPDKQTLAIEMYSGIKAEITMESITEDNGRHTVIECENAFITGDESFIDIVYKDASLPDERYDFQWTRGLSLHAGADLQIVKEFIEAIKEGHLQTKTSAKDALESHLICFSADL